MMKLISLCFLLLFTLNIFGSNTDSEFRQGMYLRTDIVAGANFDTLLTIAAQSGINNVVFDIKDMKGKLYVKINDCPTLLNKPGDLIVNLPELVSKIHAADMMATARIVAFHNNRAAKVDSSFCPKDSLGNRWIEIPSKGPQWLDPSLVDVQNDLFKLMDVVIKAGVDEIQFDYIRFPTQGNVSKAIFEFQRENDRQLFLDSTYVAKSKMDIIEDFLRKVDKRYKGNKVHFTADIFAIVSWQNQRDIEATGQDIRRMSKYLDVIHPMIYSSHFDNGFGYRQDVHNEPYDIIFKGIKRTTSKLTPGCEVVPYIQANNWLVIYKKEYIAAQVAACREAGAAGYLLWNATLNYQTTLGWLTELNTNQ
ncbi:MAG: putative glycoside hydrolase [Candidatus Stygibacter australis]|nr:putative glycoside hydrolase [Candidatus Stygibacter australis]